MNFTDIMTLAKQGYKPGDIKELIEVSQALDEAKVKEDPKPPEPVNEKLAAELDEVKKALADTKAQLEKALSDSKALADTQAELDKTKETLKKAQKANASEGLPIPEKKTEEEALQDIAKALMR